MLDRRLAPRPPGQLLRAPGPPRTRCQGGSCCASRCGHRVTHVKGQARHTSPAVNTVAKARASKEKASSHVCIRNLAVGSPFSFCHILRALLRVYQIMRTALHLPFHSLCTPRIGKNYSATDIALIYFNYFSLRSKRIASYICMYILFKIHVDTAYGIS